MSIRKILVLGSGMVARPCVEYLVRDPKNRVTVGCRTTLNAQSLTLGLPYTETICIDVNSTEELDFQIAAHDLVISLVPYVFHVAIIKSAIKNKKHVVTTSYASPGIRDLDTAAKEAGIIVLNEVGADPGVDHLNAVKMIHDIHEKGGLVREFYSFCGGLPAPEHSENPLKFKFSWSPRGVFLSQLNSAEFFQDGKIVKIEAQDLMNTAKPYYVMDGYDFVAYPNRNSVPFREFYQIPEAHTVVRGTLRYKGNPSFVKALIDLGWIDINQKSWLKDGLTWAQIFQKITDAETHDENSLIDQVKKLCKFASEAESERIISGLHWIGLFSSENATITGGNILDTLCTRLEQLMSYQPGERDLLMLQHKFVVEWADGKKDTFTSTLELLGNPSGYSAMSLAVGITCGIATQLLLDGHPALNTPGVLVPYTKEICDPIRERVEQEGIVMVEKKIS